MTVPPTEEPLRHGVVTVVPEPSPVNSARPIEERRFLIIRRSESVIAPGKLCFPGGGILPGETAEAAASREFREEIGVESVLGRPIWENITPWRVHLRWFSAALADPRAEFRLEPKEVAECFWLDFKALLEHPDLLTSNIPFLQAALDGRVVL